jgi:NADPH:quinone reductase-like Zn-dependent oxidoreductase
MKVVELQNKFGLESLVVTERPRPEPGPGQVLVRVRAASLNFRDLLLATGAYDPRIKLPFIPLSDGAGEVAAVGDGVTRLRAGDRVANLFMTKWKEGELTSEKAGSALGGAHDGMLAEYVVLSEDAWVKFPDHLTFEQAATLPCAGVTAWNALMTRDPLKPGDTVLVQGTGGVSLFALQFANLAGARVIVTSSNDDKLARTRQFGATDGVNYRKTPDWEIPVRALTGGRGVDQVVEVGGAGTLPKSLKAVRTGGVITLIGILTGGAGTVNPLPLLMKAVMLRGIFVGSGAMFEAMNQAIAQHRLEPVVDRIFPIDQVREALNYLKSGAHFGKIVLRIP